MTQPKRRSQEERSAGTISALREAAIALMVEMGYVNTTANRIAERAGVSRGALLHHYSDKTDLVIDATGSLWDTSVADTRELSAALSRGDIGFPEFIEGLWDRSFSERNVSVTIDMIIAARGDPRLAAHLADALEQRMFTAYAEAAEVMFSRTTLTKREQRVAMTMVSSFIRGLRVAEMMEVEPDLLPAARKTLVTMLEALLSTKTPETIS